MRKISDLPSDIRVLLDASQAEGFGALAKLCDGWDRGENRFSRSGEALFEARDAERGLVGICGLNVDPYTDRVDVGRVRHLYVVPSARRRGIATTLLREAIHAADGRFTILRVRTYGVEAARLYASEGFDAVDDPHATHALRL